MKERNRIASSTYERQRIKAGYGDHEANERDRAVSVNDIYLHGLRALFATAEVSALYPQNPQYTCVVI